MRARIGSLDRGRWGEPIEGLEERLGVPLVGRHHGLEHLLELGIGEDTDRIHKDASVPSIRRQASIRWPRHTTGALHPSAAYRQSFTSICVAKR